MKHAPAVVGSLYAENAYDRHNDAEKDHNEDAVAKAAPNTFEEDSPDTVQTEASASQCETNQKAHDMSQL
jgi:hypothetical protein